MYLFLVAIQALSVIFLIFESGYSFSKTNADIHKYLFLNCVATLVNNAGYLMQMISRTEGEYMVSLKMSYLGRAWIPFSLFMFAMFLCNINVKRYIIVGLSSFHAITFLLVLTSRWHKLYYTSYTYVRDNALFPYVKCGHGIWHTIYSVAMLAYIMFGVSQLIYVTYKEKNARAKKRLLFVTLAMTVESAGFIVNLTGVTGGYDTTALGYTIGTLFMYIAIFKYNLLDTLQLARDYALDELSEAIMAVNADGRIEYINKPAKEILSRRSFDVEQCMVEMEKAVAANEPLRLDGRVYTAEERDLLDGDDVRGKVYVLLDDTDHYQYMQDLKEQKEIAENANASKSAFLSIVSHEIRTPMNAVVGMTDLILRDKEKLPDKHVKYLKNIRNSGASLVMIVNDILDQSKIESGKMEIVDAVYELRPMISDVEMIIENRVGSKPVKIEVEIADDVPKFMVGDSLRIRQILINLMNNSVKFTEVGYVRLSIDMVKSEEGRSMIKFSIKDSGQGIRPEDLKRLGQAFSQVNTAKNHSIEGTGLGLYITKEFIQMMGGQLSVISEYGKGSEFYFSIWQGISNGMDESGESVTKQAWKVDEDFYAPDARILVVDDTEVNLLITKELMAPIKMTIDTVTSGEKAIEAVKSNRYDLVFMDYMMPYMDGVETTKRIRSLDGDNEEITEYYRQVPIIALTADSSENVRNSLVSAGIDDFTDKPVEIKRLKAILLKWLPKDKIKAEVQG